MEGSPLWQGHAGGRTIEYDVPRVLERGEWKVDR